LNFNSREVEKIFFVKIRNLNYLLSISKFRVSKFSDPIHPNLAFLLRYLRVAKFDVPKAAERIQKFFELQRDWPEVFGIFHYSAAKNAIENGYIIIIFVVFKKWYRRTIWA